MTPSSKATTNNDKNTFNSGNTSIVAINNGISQFALSLPQISSQISLTSVLVPLEMNLTRKNY